MRVLVVEDDPELGASLRLGLGALGIHTDLAASYTQGRLQASLGCYDVLILDVLLPGGSGLDLCRHLRASGNSTPILILSAKSSEDDRVRGLELGADDYLGKPFAFRELVARLRALARRSPALPRTPRQIADLTVDLDARTAERAGQPLSLTAREWALLECFVRHQGSVIDRSTLIAYVWDANHDPLANLLEVLVWRLRRKVDRSFHPKLIHTVRGAGYRFGP